MRILKWVIAACLVLDAADTVAWLGGVLPEWGGLGLLAGTLVVARGLTAAVEGMSAWLLISGRPPAREFCIASFVATAILTTLIVGFNLAPSDIPPGANVEVAIAYWIAAAIGGGLAVGRRYC